MIVQSVMGEWMMEGEVEDSTEQAKWMSKSQSSPPGAQQCDRREDAVQRGKEEQVIPAPSYSPQIVLQGDSSEIVTKGRMLFLSIVFMN